MSTIWSKGEGSSPRQGLDALWADTINMSQMEHSGPKQLPHRDRQLIEPVSLLRQTTLVNMLFTQIDFPPH